MTGRESTDTLIVGGGAAGLAVAACLRRADVPFLVLEAEDRIGASWERHYRRLRLHTDAARSALPYLPFPPGTPRYPDKQQVAAYLRAYADALDLQPRTGERVEAARHSGGRWRITSARGGYEADRLVVASGLAARPHVPPLPGLDEFRGIRLHSREYGDGARFHDLRVLVVGGGNSGAEIALDLWQHGARPTLSTRGGLRVVPRELLGVPLLAWAVLLARLPGRAADALLRPVLAAMYGDLRRHGVAGPRHGPFEHVTRRGRIPVVDVGTVDLIRRGRLPVRPTVERLNGRTVRFGDGREEPFDALVLATGFRPEVSFLDEEVARRVPEGDPARGLYACGFRAVATGMLREIGLEARRIAHDVARHRQRPRAAPSDTLGV